MRRTKRRRHKQSGTVVFFTVPFGVSAYMANNSVLYSYARSGAGLEIFIQYDNVTEKHSSTSAF
jgi:hypothetical protein